MISEDVRTPDAVEVGQALQRLEASTVFDRSASLLRLLRFLADGAAKHPDSMKETYVGTVFFNRDAAYDPRYDSIVRVSVRRLRQRLDQYYAGEGSGDSIRIEIPKGSYVPLFLRQAAAPVKVPAEQPEDTVHRAESLAAGTTSVPWWFRQPILWVAVSLLLLGAGVLFSRWRSRMDPPFLSGNVELVPLTVGRNALEFEPSTSPDGKTLAYVTRGPGSKSFQIFLRSYKPDGRLERILQTGPENALYPAWSPDGKQIAFLRCGIGPCDIATVPVSGGPVQSVQTLPTYTLPDDQAYYQYRQTNPIWTADGKGLIFPYRAPQDNAERLVLVNLATGQRRQLTYGAPSDEDAAPAMSPDGKSVAFLRRHLSHTATMILDLKTQQTQVLETEPNAAVSGLTWSRDGRGVAEGINHRAGFFLLWIPLRGRPREIPVDLPIVLNPVFANDGKSLMLLSANRSRNLAEIAGDSSDPRPVFLSKQRNTETALSPDSRQLAFLSDRSGTFEVWLAQRDGTNFVRPRQLTQGLGWYPSSITWSPDGRTLAVGISNTNEIDVVDVQSGAMNHLHLPGMAKSVLWSPEWSSDGHWIYFAAWGEKNGIFRASASPVPEVQPVMVGRVREIRLDGDRAIYFLPNYRSGIYRVPLTGDPSPKLVPQLRDVVPARAWFVEDSKIYYFDVHDSVRRLHCFDPATGATRDVTGPVPGIAFEDGSLSYDAKDRLLIYSEWAANAGSQVFALRWK